MDVNALVDGLATALAHLAETTRERDAARAQHAALLKELGEIRADIEARSTRGRKKRRSK